MDHTEAPAWARALLARNTPGDPGAADRQPPAASPGSAVPQVEVATGDDVALVTARIPHARQLQEPAFSAAITTVYQAVFAALRGRDAHHPVRFWNHIPGLHDRMAPGLDRYMAFNAGRFAAMQEWFGGVSEVRRCVATASGIGHSGNDFVLHCLASITPGTPVENPRQVPAYLYSRRFGPTPPCFSRATVATLGGERLLLMAGTASIRGEESVHIGDLDAQLKETLVNMRAVIGTVEPCADAENPLPTDMGSLRCMRDCRVYHPRPEDGARLKEELRALMPNVQEAHLQPVRADLCRSELLVEIEGVARL